MTSGLYIIRNNFTDTLYGGSTINFEQRFIDHKRKLRYGTHINAHLQAAYDRDGADAFEYIIFEEIEPVQWKLLFKEQCMLNVLFQDYDLYNMATRAVHPPTRKGVKMSAEWKAQHSERMKGKNTWMKGTKRPPEAIAKTTAKTKGFKHSEQSKANMSAGTRAARARKKLLKEQSK